VPAPHDLLLDKARAGDTAALEELVRLHHDRVYRYGRRVCRDHFDTDDAVQEAFVKLQRRPEVARHPGVLAWLYRVVLTTCLKLMRPFARERRSLGERVEPDHTVASEQPTPEAALEKWRLVRAVHDAIATLDTPHREVLILRDLEGMSGEEVCRLLGLGEAAMKSRLFRARAQIRERLVR
jgi:RNA polymerase sigma-70 factor, ECF subfamily